MSVNVSYFMDKLYQIDKELGGQLKDMQKNKNVDEFETLKIIIQQNLHSSKQKQQILEDKLEYGGKSAETMKLEIEMKDKLDELDKQIDKMNEVLRKQMRDKNKKAQVQAKEKIYANLKNQLKNLKSSEKIPAQLQLDQSTDTITQLKSSLLQNGGTRSKQDRPNTKATEQEKEAIQRFKENDAQLDDMIDDITVGINQWGEKAKQMNQKIDHTKMQMERLDKEIDKTTTNLVSSNKKLKVIIDKYREPNKFCVDIVLFIVLFIVVGILYKMTS